MGAKSMAVLLKNCSCVKKFRSLLSLRNYAKLVLFMNKIFQGPFEFNLKIYARKEEKQKKYQQLNN